MSHIPVDSAAFSKEAFFEELVRPETASLLGEKTFPLDASHVNLYESIDSTNAELLRCLEGAGALRDGNGELTESGQQLHLSLAAAASQSAGRGRQGRAFYSPDRTGIYFSYSYIPKGGVQDPSVYTVSSVVGVCRAIEKLYGVQTGIKWVNDIFVRGKKVCGILTEGFMRDGAVQAVVVGIGINIVFDTDAPVELSGIAGGVVDRAVSGTDTRLQLLALCMQEIVHALSEDWHSVIDFYTARSIVLGATLSVTPLAGASRDSYPATAIAITDDAGLLVELSDGTRRTLHSGEVTLHR